MDWKKQGSRVIHESGFSVSVHKGSFEYPYEISYAGSRWLSHLELVKMIRFGLEYGRCLEREAQDSLHSCPACEPRCANQN
jgi:hypothetical protein